MQEGKALQSWWRAFAATWRVKTQTRTPTTSRPQRVPPGRQRGYRMNSYPPTSTTPMDTARSSC